MILIVSNLNFLKGLLMLLIVLFLEILHFGSRLPIGIDSLSIRRDFIDIMFTYDISNSYINFPAIFNLIGFRILSRNAWISDLFHISKFNTNCGKNSFFTRALFNANTISTVLDFLFYFVEFLKLKHCYFYNIFNN